MPDCIQNCPVTARVDALEEHLDELQTQNSASHKEYYARLGVLEQSKAVQKVRYDAIMSKLDNLTHKVERLEQKPVKRWETAIAALISALVGAVAAYLLAGGRIG